MAWQTMNNIAQYLVVLGVIIGFVGSICGFVSIGMRYYQGGF